MKTLIFVLVLALSSPLFAQTYTDTEFIVEGETRTVPVVAQPGTATVITTTAQPGTTIVTTAPTGEAPVYVGMSKYLVIERMGEPTAVDKFKKFAGRQQGTYTEVWTYQTSTGVTYVYIKDRNVAKVEYR